MVQRMPKDEPVVMHEEGYSRLSGLPTPQMQAYLVGNRSASAYELQSIICYFLRAMMPVRPEDNAIGKNPHGYHEGHPVQEQ